VEWMDVFARKLYRDRKGREIMKRVNFLGLPAGNNEIG
jgi:hypothetical protein